jgi:hydrogenase nickel incorporation protein HypB
MFQAASLLSSNRSIFCLTSTDLDRCQAYARQVNPAIEIMTLSAKTGEGLATWFGWISAASRRERGGSFPQPLEAVP